MKIRCLACACEYYPGVRSGTLCPRRYLSPHTEEHMQRVVGQLGANGVEVGESISREDHQKALKDLETDCE